MSDLPMNNPSSEGRPAVTGEIAIASAPTAPGQMPARPATGDDNVASDEGYPQLPTAPIAGPYDMVPPGVVQDAGSDNTIEATVAAAVADQLARREEMQTDTYGQGSVIGDLMSLPEVPLAHAKSTGPPDGFASQQ